MDDSRCVACTNKLCHVDADPDGAMNSKCAQCTAEEDHDYNADPDAEFNRLGERVGVK